ncbi:MAG: Gfo/Idh/MocA family oxidoreductase, partial [Chloroflexota bacterium]
MSTTDSTPRKLRHVAIGVGAGIFNSHRIALDNEATDLVAVADINPEAGQVVADELGCAFYTDHKQMLAETKPDIASIVTPHPFHAPLAIDCFEAGAHVLVEKPIAVEIA